MTHSHPPSHTFILGTEETTLNPSATKPLASGRSLRAYLTSCPTCATCALCNVTVKPIDIVPGASPQRKPALMVASFLSSTRLPKATNIIPTFSRCTHTFHGHGKATKFTWGIESKGADERLGYSIESYQSASFVFPFQKIVVHHTYSCTFTTLAICEHMEIPQTLNTKDQTPSPLSITSHSWV